MAEEKDALVTIGIKPTFPSTGYGYIRSNRNAQAAYYEVEEFVEKPDLETAQGYLESGQYAWNSGMFVWKASVILGYFERLLPDIYECLVKIGDAMGTDREKQVIQEVYPVIPKISVDYGIMERAKGVLMVEGDFGWNDVGSFDALEEIYEKDENGNVILANGCLLDTDGCILYGDGEKLIATLGVQNLVIAQTKDIILVCDKKRAQDIKLIPETLANSGKDKFC